MAAIVIQHRLNSFLYSFVLGQPQYTEDISYFSLILCLQYASNDKICCYCLQKNADISKLKGALILKVYFLKLLKLHMSMYLCAKLQVSSITLTSFRQGWGVILPPPPPLPQKEPLKAHPDSG